MHDLLPRQRIPRHSEARRCIGGSGSHGSAGSSGDTIPNSSELGMVSLRQESFGKEEETRTLKPFVETLRVRIPPGKAGPAARNESCVAVGRPILRSVDSEVKGRVIEPRKYKTPGAFVVDTGGGRVRQLTLGPLSLPDPAGVEEHGQ